MPQRQTARTTRKPIDWASMGRNADTAANLLKALANSQRLHILCLLVGGERSVGELNAELGLSQSALSQHLAKLRAEGMVRTRREAQTIWYALEPGPAEKIIATLYDAYCAAPPTPRKRKPA